MTPAPGERWIEIDIARQHLWLREGDAVLMECPVSTARNGPGEVMDSECTPRGWHAVASRIGEGLPENSVLVARQPTGEVYAPDMRQRYPGRDWILTRILWLRGLEPGRNAGGRCDSQARYIYIHGAPDDVAMGKPGSRGCVRMRNLDVVQLFERVREGTPVLIRDS
jgi:hypothetical protein